MYTSIRRYRCRPEDAAEIAHRADATFADRLGALRGFVSYELLDCGDGTVFTHTVFSDRESAERSADLAADFVRDELRGLDLERTEMHTGQVLVSRASNDALELVHA
jgi:hypothetical protein